MNGPGSLPGITRTDLNTQEGGYYRREMGTTDLNGAAAHPGLSVYLGDLYIYSCFLYPVGTPDSKRQDEQRLSLRTSYESLYIDNEGNASHAAAPACILCSLLCVRYLNRQYQDRPV